MAVIIAMLNQKGGVGKTTVSANLGGTWAKSGRRVIERTQTVEMQTIQSARESRPFTRTPNRARTPLHG